MRTLYVIVERDEDVVAYDSFDIENKKKRKEVFYYENTVCC